MRPVGRPKSSKMTLNFNSIYKQVCNLVEFNRITISEAVHKLGYKSTSRFYKHLSKQQKLYLSSLSATNNNIDYIIDINYSIFSTIKLAGEL